MEGGEERARVAGEEEKEYGDDDHDHPSGGEEEDYHDDGDDDDDYDDDDDDHYGGDHDDAPVTAVGARSGPKKKKKKQQQQATLASPGSGKTRSSPTEAHRTRSLSSTHSTHSAPSSPSLPSPSPSSSSALSPSRMEQPFAGLEVDVADGAGGDDDAAAGEQKVEKKKKVKGGYLKPAHLILPRFRWDPKLNRILDRCSIGYMDRFDGLMECPYTSFQTVDESDEGIPLHRIRYFKIDDLIVWDRESRRDLLTPGTWKSMIAGVDTEPALSETDSYTKKKAVLFACGSFCPVHRQHIHMLETAKKHLEQKRGFEVLAAILSPTADNQLKKKFWEKDGFLSNKEPNPPGFIPAFHRARIIELAAEGRTWIKPDLWASQHNAPSAKAREHVHEVLNPIGSSEEIQLISVFGADTLKRVGSFKKKKASMICVVNRQYEFDAQELFDQKMKGVPAATQDNEEGHFIDLVFAEDGDACQIDASATLIREAFLSGDMGLAQQVSQKLLSSSVMEYILRHRLLPPRPKRTEPRTTIHDLANSILAGIDIGTEIRWEELQGQNDETARSIGKGISSETFAMTYKGRPVALKVFSFANSSREPPRRVLKYMFNEIVALRKLKHKNVIKYVGTGALAEKVFVALELATHGCLAYFLSKHYFPETYGTAPAYDKSERWQWKTDVQRWGNAHNMKFVLKLLLDVARGMAHLHERGIIHRDLSIDNVLVTEETDDAGKPVFVAKVSDLGVCQMLSPEESAERVKEYATLLLSREQRRRGKRSDPSIIDATEEPDVKDSEEAEAEPMPASPVHSTVSKSHHLVTVRGNMRNYAPEAVEDGRFYCPASDVFMFSLLMYEVLEGRQAYSGCSTHSAIKRKAKGQRPEVSSEHQLRYPGYVTLMQECWEQDPRQRPTFVDVIPRLEALMEESSMSAETH